MVPRVGTFVYGYEATLLVAICQAIFKAFAAGALQQQQVHTARQVGVFLSYFGNRGVIALIDEVTGYQKVCEANVLQAKHAIFITEARREWERTFPEVFWIELCRLEGRSYIPGVRPLYWGKYLVEFVYNAVDKDIIHYLRELNPEPHHGSNHHQWLTAFGRQELLRHIDRLLIVMRLCRDMADFRAKFAHLFNQAPLQSELFE